MTKLTNGTDLVDPHAYASNGVPHETWTRLRKESPVHHCVPDGFEPYWAITRHADICEISKTPEKFLSQHGIVVLSDEQVKIREGGDGTKFSVINFLLLVYCYLSFNLFSVPFSIRPQSLLHSVFSGGQRVEFWECRSGYFHKS